jgi:starch-binding outer membrane protein, SusD/RagB family
MMKNYIKSIKVVSTVLLVTLISYGCTDLDENLPSELTADQFGQSETEIISSIGEAYTIMAGNWGSHNGLWSIHEVASDEAAIPQKGQDWFDGGIWLRVHRHTFTRDEGAINNAWGALFQGVNTSNRLIFTLQTIVEEGGLSQEEADEFIGELRAVRAFYYFWLLDTFGNVPLITDFETAPERPANNSDFAQGRTELFNFIESELTAVADLVSDNVDATYGRINKFAVHALLGKLYLNAEVYTGTPRWQDAIDQFDIIIDSGEFQLSGGYFENFAIENANSPENIFVIPYDEVFLSGFNLNQMTLHYGQQFEFNLQQQPWNGYTSTQTFYESFEDSDVRKNGFLSGPRFDTNGNPIIDDALLPTDTDTDPELVLRPEINELAPNACRECGVRFGKFEIASGELPEKSNDWPLLRYADVLLSKAEAQWRLGTGNPLLIVNEIRDRSNADPLDALTAENLLAERGRELYLEMFRRQDLIRFEGQNGGVTAFNDPWDFKDVSDPNVNVFPIPREQIEANSNLTQNPGF